MPAKYPDSLRDEVIKFSKDNPRKNYSTIARKFNISTGTSRLWIKETQTTTKQTVIPNIQMTNSCLNCEMNNREKIILKDIILSAMKKPQGK